MQEKSEKAKSISIPDYAFDENLVCGPTKFLSKLGHQLV